MEKRYIVKKKLDMFDFMEEHKREYGWRFIENSCKKFRKDIKDWAHTYSLTGFQSVGEILRGYTTLSSEFIPHLIKYGFIEEELPKETDKIGDIFKCTSGCFSGALYILTASNSSLIRLINLQTGSPWTTDTKVINPNSLSEAEVTRIFANRRKHFKKVSGKIVVKEENK